MRQSSRKPFYVYAIIMVLLLGLLPADLGSVARADSDYRLQETFETYSTGAKPAGWTIKTPPQGVSVGVQAWEGYPGKLLELEQTSKLASSYSISKSVTDVTYRSMFSYSFRAEQTGAVIYLPTPQSGSVPLVKFAINNGAFSYMKKVPAPGLPYCRYQQAYGMRCACRSTAAAIPSICPLTATVC